MTSTAGDTTLGEGARAATPPALRARGLAVGYGGRRRQPVLSGLDFELAAGELVCLLGPNGAGKSTLLRTLAGLLPPLDGRLELDGRDLRQLGERQRARRLGLLTPARALPPVMTVRELVELGRYPHTSWNGRLAPDDQRAVDQAIDAVGARGLALRPVSELSDGERQKANLARLLAQDPAVLLLDEVTAFLDLPRRVEVMRLLTRLAHHEARAILLSTHDLDLALRNADRLWLLPPGGPLLTGTPDALVATDAFERTFGIGSLDIDLATLIGALRPSAVGS